MAPGTTTREIRDLVYGTLAAEGRAPSLLELARKTQHSRDAVQSSLKQLAEAHALVLSRDGDAIRMAHPFSAAPMAYVVAPVNGFDDRHWWGGCAWDSFGMMAALDLDVRIDTACPQCGSSLSYVAGPNTAPPAELAVRFPRPAAEWWNDVVDTCSNIRTYCSVGHAEAWTAEHAPGTGYVAVATAVWRLAIDWYGDRLSPDFTPHTREFNQQLLAGVEFTGDFWELP